MRVFIDGEAGTTGLHIRQRLQHLPGFSLLSIDPAQRKDPQAKQALFAQADVAILCLHDDDARASVAQVQALRDQGQTAPRVIDASTAHRTAQGWVYGFAELCAGQAQAIAQAQWVSNPGCYATGAIALLRPLIDAGLLSPEAAVCLPRSWLHWWRPRRLRPTNRSSRAQYQMYALAWRTSISPKSCIGAACNAALVHPSGGQLCSKACKQLLLHLDWLGHAPRRGH